MLQCRDVMAFVISPVDVDARKNLDLRSGDTVRVHQKIEEKGKTRIQTFEGLVLARKHGTEAGGTFTVRRVSSGVGVEKIFPLYSPMIDKIEVIKRATMRRAKLYFIREKAAKAVRRQLRNARMVNLKSDEVVPTETLVTEAPTSEVGVPTESVGVVV